MAATFYWHDYETWGTDPARDRPSQFAGQRTDWDLNVIGEPLVIYNRPTPDMLPHPQACLITGITPQKAAAEGLNERDFIAAIHAEMSVPQTCNVGYNSMRFDDEVTRFTLYRNFYDAYQREWQGGNSRWDLIDVVRLCCALRPDGIEWPLREDGAPSFKLEHLSKANGLEHANAHDALSDVLATIELAKKVKNAQPKLFEYALSLRRKQAVIDLLDLQGQTPLLHVSQRFPASQYCAAMVMPLMWHPTNRNSVICYDLMKDPSAMLSLGADGIRERLFAQGEERIALKEVHINRSPMLATSKVVDDKTERRLGLDLALCRAHWQMIREHESLNSNLTDVYSNNEFKKINDPEAMLYSGGFFSGTDKQCMAQIRAASAEQLASQSFSFSDDRLPELLFRYRARNFPETLDATEKAEWQEHCRVRLEDPTQAGITRAAFQEELTKLRSGELSARDESIVAELERWGG